LPNIHQIFGDSPAEYPRLVCVMKRGFSPPEGHMWRVCYWRKRQSSTVADRTLGNSVGAIESVACSVGAMCIDEASDLGPLRRLPAWYIPLLRELCLRASAPGFRIVTWLILPVVICLSQRLSHACLSISNYTVKLRMAH
jgi:hypothetical protein